METFKLLRHLEEKKGDEINRDDEIDPEEISLLKNYYIPEIKKDIESKKYNKIVIISSDKKRSKKTSEILNNELRKETRIPIIQEEDPKISAEKHGKYKAEMNKNNPIIQKARKIFYHESFENNNIWYRFGDVSDGKENVYGEFSEVFDSPGENQIELNIRMYKFILNLIERIERNPETLYIISTHYILISTILSIIHIGEQKRGLVELFYHPFGEMYKDENLATRNMIGGWENFYNFYKTKNYVFDIDLSKLNKMRNIIQNELDLHLAAYMQHYGKNMS